MIIEAFWIAFWIVVIVCVGWFALHLWANSLPIKVAKPLRKPLSAEALARWRALQRAVRTSGWQSRGFATPSSRQQSSTGDDHGPTLGKIAFGGALLLSAVSTYAVIRNIDALNTWVDRKWDSSLISLQAAHTDARWCRENLPTMQVAAAHLHTQAEIDRFSADWKRCI
jgi:hypothetical protein